MFRLQEFFSLWLFCFGPNKCVSSTSVYLMMSLSLQSELQDTVFSSCFHYLRMGNFLKKKDRERQRQHV